MDAEQTVKRYFDLLAKRSGWDAMLAEDIEFMRLTTPVKRVAGKSAYLEATRPFYASIASLDVRELVAEGDRVCALTQYRIRSSGAGEEFESYVAEFFSVRDSRIKTLSICFDMTPYPKR